MTILSIISLSRTIPLRDHLPSEKPSRLLESLRIAVTGKPKRILTATLSQQDWIKSIRLSQQLKMLPDADPT